MIAKAGPLGLRFSWMLHLVRFLWNGGAWLSDMFHLPGPNHLRVSWFVHSDDCNNSERYTPRMSLPIHVTSYSGYKANEPPSQFTVNEDLYEITEIEDRWYEPEATYFRVRTTEGRRYILRYDEQADEWTLQSGFDGDGCSAAAFSSPTTHEAATTSRAVSVLVDRHHSALGLRAWLNRLCCLRYCLSCLSNSCWMSSFDRCRRHLCCCRRAAAFCA